MIVKNNIKEAIKSMMTQISVIDLSQEDAIDLVSDQWADIIKAAIESADVTGVTTLVATTGTAAAQTGTGTQNNTGSLS